MPSDGFIKHPYARFVHTVQKPARYVGGEWGQIKKPWHTTEMRVCLAFPDIYDIGMSHLGSRILYHQLNQPSNMLCERAFVPWPDMTQAISSRGLQLVSLENARPLCDFHVIGISLQHELVFTNVLTLLSLGGITLWSNERGETEPLVLGGGSVATHPEPIAPFFDAFVIGDGEYKAREVVQQWVADVNRAVPRKHRLRNLAALDGVYVPSLYQTGFDTANARQIVTPGDDKNLSFPVVRTIVSDLDEVAFPPVFPTGGPEAVFDRFSVEIARGCSQGCRFCQAGMIFRPERERHPAEIVRTIVESLEKSGQDDISLTSLSPADYSALDALVHAVAAHPRLANTALNVSSLRAYGVTDATLEQLRKVRISNLTFAPEAGTERMRRVINKNVTEQQLLDTIERVVQHGWDRVKLYFMIGLPTETPIDVDGIVHLTARAQKVARLARKGKGRPVQVTASVSTFVPKPHTPFQWAPMSTLESIVEKHRQLAQIARENKVDIKMHQSHGSVLEAVLARGDRRLARVIERAWRNGASFDAWEGNVKWDVWTEAFSHHGLCLDTFLSELAPESPLPWSHIDVGVKPTYLRKEWDKARNVGEARITLPCLRPAHEMPDSALVCNQCGVQCDMQNAARIRNEMRCWKSESSDSHAARTTQTATSSMEKSTREPLQAHDDTPVTYRFRYEKLGSSCMLGHLDLVREVPRIMRRAGLSLHYTQGFHPKPVMVFGPALSLGVPSFEEYVDIRTRAPINVERIIESINQACPDGMRFVEIQEVPKGAPAVVNAICEAHLLISLNQEFVQKLGGHDKLTSKMKLLLDAPSLTIARTTKGKLREVNVRPYVLELGYASAEQMRLLDDAGVPNEGAVLFFRQAIHPQGSVRLDEIVQLLGCKQDPRTVYRAVRLALRGKEKRK